MGKRKPLAPELRPNVENIVNTFFSASDEDLAAGMEWYSVAHAHAVRIAGDDGAAIGAGVIAALSPQLGWTYNLELAERAFRDEKASGCVGANTNKANSIMWHYADPLDILGGQKVRAFYLAILEPHHVTAVVIDRHAFDIAVGRVTDDVTRRVLARVGVYEIFADAYRAAAHIISEAFGETVAPSAVQAVTWLAWRRNKGIVD